MPFVLVALVAPHASAQLIGSPQQIGTNSSFVLDEVSGLVDSRANADTFWVHNDSGDSARFYAMSRAGALLGTFSLDGVTARDWEDIAIGPKPDGGNYLYLGDVGDNDAVRSSVRVHRVVEPHITSGATIPADEYMTLNLQYPGGPRDVESMFVDAISGDLYFITKRKLVPEVYRLAASLFDDLDSTVTLEPLGTFPKVTPFATAADISPDGRFIVVRSSVLSSGYLYQRGAGQSIADALQGDAIQFSLGDESQGEAVGWAADGMSLFTTSEFDGSAFAPIYSYAFTPPEPVLPGDYNGDQRVDAADYTVWRDLLGTNASLSNETETPGMVTSEDYDVWRTHFGTLAAGAGQVAAVPEPTAWILMVAAGLFCSTRGSRSPAAACPGACT